MTDMIRLRRLQTALFHALAPLLLLSSHSFAQALSAGPSQQQYDELKSYLQPSFEGPWNEAGYESMSTVSYKVLKLGNCRLSWQVNTKKTTDDDQYEDTESITINLKLMKEQNIVLQQRKSGWRLKFRRTGPNQILYNPDNFIPPGYPDEEILKLATNGPEIASRLKALITVCHGSS